MPAVINAPVAKLTLENLQDMDSLEVSHKDRIAILTKEINDLKKSHAKIDEIAKGLQELQGMQNEIKRLNRVIKYGDFSKTSPTVVAAGLMWTTTLKHRMKQNDAIEFCDTLRYAGYMDWRLPTIQEWVSTFTFGNSATDITIFKESKPTYYWSSNKKKPDFGYVAGFASGTIGIEHIDHEFYVRAVRSVGKK